MVSGPSGKGYYHIFYLSQSIQTEQILSEEAGHLLHETAIYLRYRARYKEAETLFQKALSIQEQILGPEHPDIATTLNNLAILYYEQDNYVEAEILYKRALNIREQELGPNHSNVASPLNNLALLYADQGRYAEAEPLYPASIAFLKNN